MKDIDPSLYGNPTSEVLAPDLIRKLARHCYNLCWNDPEVGHAFLVPGMDDPQQLETVYIDLAQTDIPYNRDSLWHRTLERLKLADYLRPPSYNLRLYPSPEQAAENDTAAHTVTIDAGNKSITGKTLEGRAFSADELIKYAGHILGIQPAQETENLTPSARMNHERTSRLLQAFASFTGKGPLGQVVEAHEVTASSATAVFGINSGNTSYGLMWHNPLVPVEDGHRTEDNTPYVLRWRHYSGSKPGSILDDRALLTQPPGHALTREDISRVALADDEEKLVLPITTHDAIVERFERMLSEATPESLLITSEELSGLRTIAEDGLHLSLYFTKDSALIVDRLFERPNEPLVFNSADYISILRLVPTRNRQEYIADYVSVPPDSRQIEQAVRAVVRRRGLRSEMLERTLLSATEARTLVQEALNPPVQTQA